MILIFGGGDIATEGIVPTVGGTISYVDVCSPEAVRANIDHHNPNTIINCAGVSNPGSVANEPLDRFVDEVMVNLVGSFNVAHSAARLDVPNMIFIASVAGLYGKPGHAGYSAAKAGVISLVQSLGMEGHNAYAISPGRVDTRMRERDYPGEDPLTRLEPRQVGQVVADILAGKYFPGDNIIIRKKGYRTFRRVDRGAPWRDYLAVGLPPAL